VSLPGISAFQKHPGYPSACACQQRGIPLALVATPQRDVIAPLLQVELYYHLVRAEKGFFISPTSHRRREGSVITVRLGRITKLFLFFKPYAFGFFFESQLTPLHKLYFFPLFHCIVIKDVYDQ